MSRIKYNEIQRMDKFIKKTSQFIFSQQKSMFSSTLILSFMIVVGSFFGFIRYRILASFFSADQLDIFFASFRIPDLIFQILITGALTSTFIPIYIQYQKNKKELTENISSIINAVSIAMIIFIIIISLLLDYIIPVMTPGYSVAKNSQIVLFSRMLLMGQLPFLVLGNFLTGIGQANKTFFLASLAPVIYNLAIIAATLLLAPSLSLYAPIHGVNIGAALFFLIQLPLLFNGYYSYSLILKKTDGLVKFIRIMIPRAFTVVVAQIDATIDLTLTTLLGGGAYTIFYLAQHLQLLPVSVIGVAFGQASLPYLSEMYQERKFAEFNKIVIDSILNVFFFTIPLMSFFAFARTPLIRLFFGGQKFSWDDTVLTAITFSYFSLSLPFHSVYYFLTRCFYALLDSKTPFIISALSIAVNTGLSLLFIFIFHLPIWSLAISFSVSMLFSFIFLFIILAKKLGNLDYKYFFTESVKMTIATIFSSVITYYSMKLLAILVFDTSRTINIFFLLVTGGILYFLLYLLSSIVVDVKEIYLISKLFVKAKEYQRKFMELYTTTYE